MDTAHWPQGIGVVNKPMEGSNNNNNKGVSERRTRPQKDQAVNCPRCNSTNTKFCYYNNYSLSQPRYFCKTCRRYWTEGGSLRNVPVGGGSRKNKRSSSSSNSSSSNLISSSSLPIPSSAKKVAHDHDHPDLSLPLSFPTHPHHHQSASQNPKIFHQGQDLNLAYPPSSDHLHHHPHQDYDNMISRFVQVPYTSNTSTDNDHHNKTASHVHQNPSTTTTTTTISSSVVQLSAMELLKTGMASRGLMSSFMAMPAVLPDSNTSTMFSSNSSASGFSLAQEFKPNSSLSFDLDHGYDHHGHQSGYGSGSGLHHQGVQQEISGGARLLFPSSSDQDVKQVSTTTTTSTRGQGDHNSNATGYWNGMLGGGSW